MRKVAGNEPAGTLVRQYYGGLNRTPRGERGRWGLRWSTSPEPLQRGHLPQPSSASRFTAGAFGFFDLIQWRERPER
jgi:hypothetical protein